MINDFAGLDFCFTKLAVLIDSEMSNNYLVTTSEFDWWEQLQAPYPSSQWTTGYESYGAAVL